MESRVAGNRARFLLWSTSPPFSSPPPLWAARPPPGGLPVLEGFAFPRVFGSRGRISSYCEAGIPKSPGSFPGVSAPRGAVGGGTFRGPSPRGGACWPLPRTAVPPGAPPATHPWPFGGHGPGCARWELGPCTLAPRAPRKKILPGEGVPRGASDHTLLLVPQMSWASLRAAFPALSPAQLHRLLTQYQLASAMGPMSAWEPDARDSPEAFKSGEPDQRREQGRASWGDFQKSLQSLSPPPWWLSQLEVREPTARFRLWGQVQGPTYPTWGLMAGPRLAHTAHQEENRVSAWSAKMVGGPRTHVCSHAAYVYVHVMFLTNRCASRR